MTDPFPIVGVQGLEPTQPLDWEAMAAKLVRDVLELERHERIILSADPYFGGAMLDAVRQEIQQVRAIELATILHWTPALTGFRLPNGCQPDPEDAAAEDRAMVELFGAADAFLWLMNDRRHGRKTNAAGQTEQVLETWSGRSAHFHWFHDPLDPDPESPVNRALDRVYQRAVLELDYDALRVTMERLVGQLADAEIRVTDPAGTDLRFRLGRRFHMNYGNASRARMAKATSARDREEEIPCGCLRAIPVVDSVEGELVFESGFGFPAFGYGLDIDRFIEEGLRFEFAGGRVTRVETRGDQLALDASWEKETGDKDRLGEFVLGCNPLLEPVPGSAFQPYYGFGEGILRLTLGENIESGGENRSSTHRWLFLTEPTISVASSTLVDAGRFDTAVSR